MEILVVIAIIAILLGIAMPALSAARSATHRAQCANNQRQIAMAARLYAADFRDYMGQAAALDYRTATHTNNGQSLPSDFIKAGFTNPLTRHPDHYLALNYLPLSTNYKGNPGSDMFICPSVSKHYNTIANTYWQGKGNVESHYFFSTLLTRPTLTTVVVKAKNNVWGPYRSSQILQPNDTFLLGDAMGFSNPADPAEPATMVDTWNWDQIGDKSTVFGVAVTFTSNWMDVPPSFHRGGPNGLFYDGHVETIIQPPASDPFKLRPHFTANFSGQRE